MKKQVGLADAKPLSISMNTDLMHQVYEVLIANRLEFFMFFSAMVGYFVLCYARLPKQCISKNKEPEDESEDSVPSSTALCDAVKAIKLDKSKHIAADDLHAILEEKLQGYVVSDVNDFLERLGNELDSELLHSILSVLRSLGVKPDNRTYETLLKIHVTSHDFSQVQNVLADMEANGMPLSDRAKFFVMKGAVQAKDFGNAFTYLKELKAAWSARSTSEPLLPQSIMVMLVDLAWEKKSLGRLAMELKGIILPEKTIDCMLTKCVESKDSALLSSVESLARDQRSTLPDSTYSLLIEANLHNPPSARAIVKEVLAREGSVFAPDLATTMIKLCTDSSDAATVDLLFQRMKPKPISVLGAFAWFYISAEKFEKVCDIYELDISPMCNNGDTSLEASLHESIVDAAVVCGRTHLAERLVREQAASRMHLAISWRHRLEQLFEGIMLTFARWNATVSYWVVLVF